MEKAGNLQAMRRPAKESFPDISYIGGTECRDSLFLVRRRRYSTRRNRHRRNHDPMCRCRLAATAGAGQAAGAATTAAGAAGAKNLGAV